MLFAVVKYLTTKAHIPVIVSTLFFMIVSFVPVHTVGHNMEFGISFAMGLLCSYYHFFDSLDHYSKRLLLLMSAILVIMWAFLLPYYQSFYLNPFYDLLHRHSLEIFAVRQVLDLSFALGCCILFMTAFNMYTKFSKWGANTWYVHSACLYYGPLECKQNFDRC